MKKKQLGQFFTTNADYILNGFADYIKDKEVTDPFAGSGDLLTWASQYGASSVKGYDIDVSRAHENVELRDSLINPCEYKFVLTNPPYLNINKANQETKVLYFKNSNFEDLYHISINSTMNSDEGILIVPLNFLSANNSKSIRNIFFSKFQIEKINYYKQKVFEDTTNNVIAFYYKKKTDVSIDYNDITIVIYPEGREFEIKLEKKYNWRIGGDFLSKIKKQKNILKIKRLTDKELVHNDAGASKVQLAYNNVNDIQEYFLPDKLINKIKNNIILLKAIDSGSDDGKIALEDIRQYGIIGLASKNTSRHQIQLIFGKEISIESQIKLIELFNSNINILRERYFSLFLTNYRDNDRKRISFYFVYKYLNLLYFQNFA